MKRDSITHIDIIYRSYIQNTERETEPLTFKTRRETLIQKSAILRTRRIVRKCL